MPHPGRGLVEQHHLRIEGERGGDLEGALAAVGEHDRRCAREGAEPDGVDQLHRPRVEALQHTLGPPEVEGAAPPPL